MKYLVGVYPPMTPRARFAQVVDKHGNVYIAPIEPDGMVSSVQDFAGGRYDSTMARYLFGENLCDTSA